MTQIEIRLKELFNLTDYAAKDIADELLSMAHKQIVSEIDVDAMVERFIKNLPAYTVIHEGVDKRLWGEPYRKGIEDTLKVIGGK